MKLLKQTLDSFLIRKYGETLKKYYPHDFIHSKSRLYCNIKGDIHKITYFISLLMVTESNMGLFTVTFSSNKMLFYLFTDIAVQLLSIIT